MKELGYVLSTEYSPCCLRCDEEQTWYEDKQEAIKAAIEKIKEFSADDNYASFEVDVYAMRKEWYGKGSTPEYFTVFHCDCKFWQWFSE